MSDPTDASTNSIPRVMVDPKLRFDSRRAASPPPGYYPNGIEQTDNELEDFQVDAADQSVVRSVLPKTSNRLIDNPPQKFGSRL